MALANPLTWSLENTYYKYDRSTGSVYEMNYTDDTVADSVKIWQSSTDTDVACRTKSTTCTDLESWSNIIDLTREEENAEALETSLSRPKDTSSSDTTAKSIEEALSSNSEARPSLAVAAYPGSRNSDKLTLIKKVHPEASRQPYRMNELAGIRNGGTIPPTESVQLGGSLNGSTFANSLPSHRCALASAAVVTLLETDPLHPKHALGQGFAFEKLRDAILLVLRSETSEPGCSLSGPANSSAHTPLTAVPSFMSIGSTASSSVGWEFHSYQPSAKMSFVEPSQLSPSPAIPNRKAASSSKLPTKPNSSQTHETPSELAPAQQPQKRPRGRPKKGQGPPPTVWCKGCGHPGGGPRTLTSHRNRANADQYCKNQVPSPAFQARLAEEAAEKSDKGASTSK